MSNLVMRRIRLAIRILLALFGCYGVAVQTDLLAAEWAKDKVNGVYAGMLLSLAVYPLLGLYVLAARRVREAVAVMSVLALLLWLARRYLGGW